MWRGLAVKWPVWKASSSTISRSICSIGGGAQSPLSQRAASFDCSSANGKIVGIAWPSPTKARSSTPGLSIRLYSGSTFSGALRKSASKNGKLTL